MAGITNSQLPSGFLGFCVLWTSNLGCQGGTSAFLLTRLSSSATLKSFLSSFILPFFSLSLSVHLFFDLISVWFQSVTLLQELTKVVGEL